MKNWNLVSRANGISYWLLSKKVGLFKYLFDQLREIYQRLFQYIDKRNNKISGIWKKIRLKENSIVYYSCGKRSKETTKDWFVIELWLKLFFTVFTKIQKNYHLKIYSECQYFAITLQSRYWIQWWRSIEETKVAFSNWNSTSMFFVCCLLIRHRVSWHYIRVCATKVLVDEWFIVLSREKIYSCVQRKLFSSWITTKQRHCVHFVGVEGFVATSWISNSSCRSRQQTARGQLLASLQASID